MIVECTLNNCKTYERITIFKKVASFSCLHYVKKFTKIEAMTVFPTDSMHRETLYCSGLLSRNPCYKIQWFI